MAPDSPRFSSTPTLEAIKRRFDPALQRRMPPTAPALPLVGNFFELQADVLELMSRSRRELGDIFRLRFGPFDFIVVHRPETIRALLLERSEDFGRSPTYEGMRRVLGEGLLTTEGADWKWRRKRITPAFHHEQLRALAQTMVACASELGERWDAHLALHPDEPIDLHAHATALTFRIVGRTLFSTELSLEGGARAPGQPALGPAIETLLEHANHVTMKLFLTAPAWVPSARNRKFAAATKLADERIYALIAERRRSGELGEDVLGMLMRARDEQDGRARSDRNLRDEIATLVMAGHETTAQALSWLFMLLSQHPAIERRVAEEIREVCGSRPPRVDDLSALSYTRWAIDEALRLYPPAWMFERQARRDVELEGYPIPRGTVVAVVPWTLHRHPSLWSNPEGFDPERFAPARSQERPRYAYLPFGGGQRTCIGNNFALHELVLVSATLLQRHTLELVPGQDLRPKAELTLRPRAGMKMRLRRRRA